MGRTGHAIGLAMSNPLKRFRLEYGMLGGGGDTNG